MSLMALKKGFEKHGKIWGGIFGFILVVSVVFTGFGNNLSGSGRAPAAQVEKAAPVAKVGEAEVTRGELDEKLKELLQQQAMFGGQTAVPGPAEKAKYRYLLLNQVKQEQAVVLAAKKAGVQVTDADIDKKREEIWQAQRGSFAQTLGLKEDATDADIDHALAQQAPGMSVARLKETQLPAERIRTGLYQEGLANALKKAVPVTEDEVKKSYDEIQVRHILIKSGAGGLPEAQAKEKAEKVLKEVLADPSKMPALAAKYSDDPGSKNKGGLYDWAPGSQYVTEFTQGALAAGVGKVNPQPIKTQFGYHIIKLEGERPGKDFPKDWDKEKAKYIDQYKERQVGGKVNEAITAELPNVKVDITDPMLLAAQNLEEARTMGDEKAKEQKYQAALVELAKIKKEDDPEGAAPLLRGEAYKALKKTPEAIAAYEDALTYANTADTRLTLAQLYIDNKDKVNALKQVDEAEKLAIPDVQKQFQLAMMLQQLGEKERYKAAMDKANEMMKRMSERSAPKLPPTATAPKPKAVPAGKGSPAVAASPVAKSSPAASPAADGASPEASASPDAKASPAAAPSASPAAKP